MVGESSAQREGSWDVSLDIQRKHHDTESSGKFMSLKCFLRPALQPYVRMAQSANFVDGSANVQVSSRNKTSSELIRVNSFACVG